MSANAERDARAEAIWKTFMTPANRDLLTSLISMTGNKDAKDRAYLDDMRRG